MNTFRDYFLHQQYSRMEELGDKLGEMKQIIDYVIAAALLDRI
jgi:hypothetical protein